MFNLLFENQIKLLWFLSKKRKEKKDFIYLSTSLILRGCFFLYPTESYSTLAEQTSLSFHIRRHNSGGALIPSQPASAATETAVSVVKERRVYKLMEIRKDWISSEEREPKPNLWKYEKRRYLYWKIHQRTQRKQKQNPTNIVHLSASLPSSTRRKSPSTHLHQLSTLKPPRKEWIVNSQSNVHYIYNTVDKKKNRTWERQRKRNCWTQRF